MGSDVYEVISLAARYWFTFLGVLIVWRSFRWLRKDRKAKHRRLKQLPDAGMVGELVVLDGSNELPPGTALPLPREGTLGCLRTCDVTLPAPGVAPCHLDFSFQDGKGLLIYPRVRCTAQVDGSELTARSRSRDYPMHHGSRLIVGDAVLRLRLFVGLETEQHAAVTQEEPAETPVSEAPQAAMDWQNTPYVYHQIPAAWVDQTGQFQPMTEQNPPDGWQTQAYYDPQTGLPYPPAQPQDWTQPIQLPPQGDLPYVPVEPTQRWTPQAPDAFPDNTPADEEEDFQPRAARGRKRPFMRRRGHGEE